MVAFDRQNAGVGQRGLGVFGDDSGIGDVSDGIFLAGKAKSHGFRNVVRGRKGIDAHSGYVDRAAGLDGGEGELFERGLRAARLRTAEHGTRPVLAPDGESLDMVGVFMGKDERFDIFNVQLELVHTLEHLAPRKTVIDHDKSLRPLHERAVAL